MTARNRYRVGRSIPVVSAAFLLVGAATVNAQDWASWRGPANNGMTHGDAPITWDESVNLKWKIPIVGRGFSSPVVWGDQIFITTAVRIDTDGAIISEPERSRPVRRAWNGEARHRGDWRRRSTGRDGQNRRRDQNQRGGWWGRRRDSEPQAAHRFLLLSIDKTTGAVLWERAATEATPHEGFHPYYGSFASHSPVTDGEHVFAYFGSRGVYCYDLAGNLIWSKDLGQMSKIMQFGEGTPIVLHEDYLIIKWDHEGESFIVALDKARGEELWRTLRDEITSWSPPLVVDHEGQKQVIVAATRKVRSYDLETGDLIWEVAGLGRNQIPAPVHHGNLVYVMSGFIAPNLMAIQLGNRGDLTDTGAIVWSNALAVAYTVSPVLFGNQLYVLTDRGVLTNFDATTGEVRYRERLPGPSGFKSSPVGANGKLYLSSEDGQVLVVKMGPTFKLLATNVLEDAVFIATPAIVDGQIFFRSQDSLYCITEIR